MLAAIQQDALTDPGLAGLPDPVVSSREASQPRRAAVSPLETARRREQMKALGNVVAERHRELRQGRR